MIDGSALAPMSPVSIDSEWLTIRFDQTTHGRQAGLSGIEIRRTC
jgi:hypothetical protein